MTGYKSKKAAALDKLNDDDDTQVYDDALLIAYQSGYYDGKKAAQAKVEGPLHVVCQCDKCKAQPVQEPVAWLEPEWGEKICPEVGYEVTMTDDHPRDLCWIPLVAQRTWIDLTDEEIDELRGSPMKFENSAELTWVRIIEAKLKERNA